MSANLATVSYIGATILFILSLGGLSNPESSRRGNLFGMIGMTIAVLATVFGPRVTTAGIHWIIGAMVVGGAVGLADRLDEADALDALDQGGGQSDGDRGLALVGAGRGDEQVLYHGVALLLRPASWAG